MRFYIRAKYKGQPSEYQHGSRYNLEFKHNFFLGVSVCAWHGYERKPYVGMTKYYKNLRQFLENWTDVKIDEASTLQF